MEAGGKRDASELVRRLFTVRNGSLLFLVFCVGATLVSVGITFVLARVLGSLDTGMGQIGQIFESVNAAFSGLGFIALVVTFRSQYDELVLQRLELGNQREAMDRTQAALHRSAEADMRICHIELVRMSLEDQDLAEVWPGFQNGLSAKTAKQHAYVNLIVQHHRMMHGTGFLDDDDIRSTFGHLLSSPVVREFWAAAMAAREIAPRSQRPESDFNALVDRAFRETRSPCRAPADQAGADVIDLGIRRQSDAV